MNLLSSVSGLALEMARLPPTRGVRTASALGRRALVTGIGGFGEDLSEVVYFEGNSFTISFGEYYSATITVV